MHKKTNDKNQRTPSDLSFKKILASSGYSENVADKIWKWYNPPELSQSSPKRHQATFNEELNSRFLFRCLLAQLGLNVN